MTYHCKNCLNIFTQLKTTNTFNKENVSQCDICFSIDTIIHVCNFDDDCIICLNKSNNKNIFNCGHWICDLCNNQYDKNKCPTCDAIIISNNKKDDFIDYFGNTNVKKYFKLLYAQINDTIGVKINFSLYELCIEYYKFLCLLHINDNNKNISKLSPPYWIDKVWHKHLLDNGNYNKVCKCICNYTLKHYPSNSFKVNQLSYDERYMTTIELYKKHFNEIKNKNIFSNILLPKNTICLIIETLAKKKIILNISPNSTFYMVKESINKNTEIPIENQRILYTGKFMPNDNTLNSCGIKDGDRLILFMENNINQTSNHKTIFVKDLSDGSTSPRSYTSRRCCSLDVLLLCNRTSKVQLKKN